eukprot:gene7143-9638_t
MRARRNARKELQFASCSAASRSAYRIDGTAIQGDAATGVARSHAGRTILFWNRTMNTTMPMNPVLIVVLFCLGLGLAVFAAVRTPGPPLFGPSGPAKQLDPITMTDPTPGPPAMTRRHAAVGLDWLAFFTAAVQTGFGAFVVIFLAQQGWSQAQIGAALTVQTLAFMATQVPAGALVDAVPKTRLLLGAAIATLAGGALLLALAPLPVPGFLALILVAAAGSVLYPSLIALTRAIAG